MMTITFVPESACIFLVEGKEVIGWKFISKFKYDHDMYYRKDIQNYIDELLKENNVKSYKYDKSISELLDNAQPLSVKCHLENGDSFTTSINLTPEEAANYYINQVFNVGSVEDDLQKCVRIEILN